MLRTMLKTYPAGVPALRWAVGSSGCVGAVARVRRFRQKICGACGVPECVWVLRVLCRLGCPLARPFRPENLFFSVRKKDLKVGKRRE